jgi:hypothetical protein
VQRLLKALRKTAAEKLLASTAPSIATDSQVPGPVDGSGYDGPDPPTGPLLEHASTREDNTSLFPLW